MGINEALATFVADKCKKGARCTHECHQGEQVGEPVELSDVVESPGTGVPMEAIEVPIGETAVLTAPRCQHVLQGGRQCALVEGHADGHLDEEQAPALEPIEISGGGDSEGGTDSPAASEAPAGVVFDELPIEWIVPAPDNVRRQLGDLSGLVESIKANGVMEPVLVVPCDKPDGADHRYHLVAGERRWTAAQEAGLREIPAMVRPAVSDEIRLELMLVENLQRKDLDPLEEADGYRRLADLGRSQREIAGRVGCSQAHVSKRLALLDLAPKVVEAVGAGKVSVTDALEFSKLEDHKHQEAALKVATTAKYGHAPSAEAAVEAQIKEIERDEKRAAIEAEADKKGWPIVKPPKNYSDKATYREIVKDDWAAGLRVDVKKHRKEPCHALLIDDRYGRVDRKEVCNEPGRHAAKGASDLKEPKPKKREPDEWEIKRREERKAVEEFSTRRVEFLKPRLAKKVAQATALPIIARAAIEGTDYGTKALACELLGIEAGTNIECEGALRSAAEKSPDEMLRVALGCALATAESEAGSDYHGFEDPGVKDLYRFLEAAGYEVSELEDERLHAAERKAEELVAKREALQQELAASDLPGPVQMVVGQIIATAADYTIEELLEERQIIAEQSGGAEPPTLTWWFQVCRVCGCTEEHACEGGCTWVEDDLCSTCAPKPEGDSDGITDDAGAEELVDA